MLSSPVFAKSHLRALSPTPTLRGLCQRRLPRPGRGVKNSPPVHLHSTSSPQPSLQITADLPYLLSLQLFQNFPFSVSRRSFVCHSYANCRGVTSSLPILELVTRHYSFIFTFLRTLLPSQKPQLLCFPTIPNSLPKTPGVGVPQDAVIPLTPSLSGTNGSFPRQSGLARRGGDPLFLYLFYFLNLLYFVFSISIRINTSSQTPRFTVFCPKSSARNPGKINTYRKALRNSFSSNVYKKQGEGVDFILSVNKHQESTCPVRMECRSALQMPGTR
jgi:hypothetical protein